MIICWLFLFAKVEVAFMRLTFPSVKLIYLPAVGIAGVAEGVALAISLVSELHRHLG